MKSKTAKKVILIAAAAAAALVCTRTALLMVRGNEWDDWNYGTAYRPSREDTLWNSGGDYILWSKTDARRNREIARILESYLKMQLKRRQDEIKTHRERLIPYEGANNNALLGVEQAEFHIILPPDALMTDPVSQTKVSAAVTTAEDSVLFIKKSGVEAFESFIKDALCGEVMDENIEIKDAAGVFDNKPYLDKIKEERQASQQKYQENENRMAETKAHNAAIRRVENVLETVQAILIGLLIALIIIGVAVAVEGAKMKANKNGLPPRLP